MYKIIEHFLNKLLNVIINQSYIEERGIMNAQFVKDAPADPESSNTGRFQRVTSSQERKVVLPDPNIPKQFHSADLRSIDHKKVIINNINFYDNPDFFKTLRREVYGEKYNRSNVDDLFEIRDEWKDKELYHLNPHRKKRSSLNDKELNKLQGKMAKHAEGRIESNITTFMVSSKDTISSG